MGINGEDIVDDHIQLCKMKGNYILIIGLKTDILNNNDNTVIVQSTFHQKDNYMPLDYVLLVHALLDRKNPTNICWENEHLQICRASKPNTISEKTQHFGSSGFIYTFGN